MITYIHMHYLNKLVSRNLVDKLSIVMFERNRIYDICQKRKKI